ncbi:MAG TPA: PilZ domain-containing protein, partial [Nitrospiraceae bacterium]|nr:PilZ domain-containing protein [Nitrospiraceae bacterium]
MPACPQCGIKVVKPAPRRGLREYLLSVLTIGPFRCQVCTHRFLAFMWWPGTNTSRDYNRVPVRFPVLLCPAPVVGEDDPLQLEEGTLLDISIRGCAIKSTVPLHKGKLLRLKIQMTVQEPPIEIDVATVRTVTGRRVGLEFVKIRQEEEARLRRLLMTLMLGPEDQAGAGEAGRGAWNPA